MDREPDPDLVREMAEARIVRAAERRRATAWDEPPEYYDEELIPDAGFLVSRDLGIGFDAACDQCRTIAADAVGEGIAFDAAMLADVVCDLA